MPDLNRWRELWTRLGATVIDEALFHRVVERYSEPHRRYHTVQHLDECLEKLDEIKGEALYPEEVEIALWFHDAIYDPHRQDNEAKSAAWARSAVLDAGLPSAVAERVHSLIMATRHDAVPKAGDEQVLVDVDLAILGASPERFEEYERQVREEYSWVPGMVFRSRRRTILEGFLGRPTIFSTQQFIAAHEARARRNLEESIKNLGG